MKNNFKIKIKQILCLIIGFLTFNSVSTLAVENTIPPENVENYFLTQNHILKSPELYNFVIDIEKGVFPEISKLDKKQKLELENLIYKLFNVNKLLHKGNDWSDSKLDLFRTYLIEWPHSKDENYYFVGQHLVCDNEMFPAERNLSQENLRNKNLEPEYLYAYVTEPFTWNKSISVLKEKTQLSDNMIKKLASLVCNFNDLDKIVANINNNSQIKDKNEYLYNYLLASSYQLINTNDSHFREAEMNYFKRLLKEQKDAINYLENCNIDFSSINNEEIRLKKDIFSKSLDIDMLSLQDTYVLHSFWARKFSEEEIKYLNKKLTDKNAKIINLAYIMNYVVIDEQMKPEIEKLFDCGSIDNEYLYKEQFYIRINEANKIYEQLWRTGKATEKNLIKAIKKQARINHKASDSMSIKQGWGVILGFAPLLLIPLITIIFILSAIIGLIALIKKTF